jgi:transposase
VDYQRYSSQFKAAILTKLSQSDLSVRKLAGQEYSWQKQLNTSGLHMTKASSSDKWSSEEKFAVVLGAVDLLSINNKQHG